MATTIPGGAVAEDVVDAPTLEQVYLSPPPAEVVATARLGEGGQGPTQISHGDGMTEPSAATLPHARSARSQSMEPMSDALVG